MALSNVYVPKHVQTGLINILKKVGRKGDMEDGGAEALLAGAFAGMNVEVGESPLLKDVTAKVLKAFWYYPDMAIGLRETLTEILELTTPDPPGGEDKTMIEWKFEMNNGCPQYVCPFAFGPAYVESHGLNCMAKEKPGVWRVHCKGLNIASNLKAKEGHEACREAAEILSERLRDLSKMVERAPIPQPEGATRGVAVVTEVTFDSLENHLEAAIRRQIVGVFVDSESMSAKEKATRFVAQREMATEGIRFTGWDKQRYPRYVTEEYQAL